MTMLYKLSVNGDLIAHVGFYLYKSKISLKLCYRKQFKVKIHLVPLIIDVRTLLWQFNMRLNHPDTFDETL